MDFIITPTAVVHKNNVSLVELDRLEQGVIIIHHTGGIEEVSGIQAIEIVMQLRPSALEGKRLRWMKNAWFIHNVIAHPLMQILALFGCYNAAMWVHDITVPKPRV